MNLHILYNALLLGSALLCAASHDKSRSKMGQGVTKDSLSVYFLAIGSDHYQPTPPEKISQGYDDFTSFFQSGRKSAKLVYNALSRISPSKGILLYSTPDQPVTAELIWVNIQTIKNQIESDKVKKPLFVLYFFGHGISIGTRHYLVPGDWKGSINKTDEYCIAEIMIMTEEIKSAFGPNVPCLLLIDACYADYPDKKPQMRNGIDVKYYQSLLALTGPNPTIYSGSIGHQPFTHPDPFDSMSRVNIGILSARISWIESVCRRQYKTITYLEFVENITKVYLNKEFHNPLLGYYSGNSYESGRQGELNFKEEPFFRGSVVVPGFTPLAPIHSTRLTESWCKERYNQ